MLIKILQRGALENLGRVRSNIDGCGKSWKSILLGRSEWEKGERGFGVNSLLYGDNRL